MRGRIKSPARVNTDPGFLCTWISLLRNAEHSLWHKEELGNNTVPYSERNGDENAFGVAPVLSHGRESSSLALFFFCFIALANSFVRGKGNLADGADCGLSFGGAPLVASGTADLAIGQPDAVNKHLRRTTDLRGAVPVIVEYKTGVPLEELEKAIQAMLSGPLLLSYESSNESDKVVLDRAGVRLGLGLTFVFAQVSVCVTDLCFPSTYPTRSSRRCTRTKRASPSSAPGTRTFSSFSKAEPTSRCPLLSVASHPTSRRNLLRQACLCTGTCPSRP